MNGGNPPNSFPSPFPWAANSRVAIYNLHFLIPGSYQIRIPLNGIIVPSPPPPMPGFYAPAYSFPNAPVPPPTHNGFVPVRITTPMQWHVPNVPSSSINQNGSDDGGFFSMQSQGSLQSQGHQQPQ